MTRGRSDADPRIPDGARVLVQDGPHSEVLAAVLEIFCPQFFPGAEILHLDDDIHQSSPAERIRLTELGIDSHAAARLPDLLLVHQPSRRLLGIELSEHHGAVTRARRTELDAMLGACTLEPVFVSVFPNMNAYGNQAHEIAWNTHIWLVDTPAHSIHHDGGGILAPRTQPLA